ncbi:stage IV sporulation protein B [Thermaerobacter subterraneus DSM 13965]|uniref:Stage IV sporulation protein B n=1 Tax=Thermaerobacter subterraneus DSM 13965 TaxID=867903 RepID=K6PYM6_9FIRM|nr:SpoIVB peptidase [Thermaerobacter subterraneus]EKP93843.1 stage IV sporulation protein B [Thermaerobacter subterraneus DSM 13965]
MRPARVRRAGVWGAAAAAFLLVLLARWQVAIPGHVRLTPDSVQKLGPGLPIPISVRAEPPGVLDVGGGTGGTTRLPLSLAAQRPGVARLEMSLFGWMPLRPVTVEVVPRVEVVPGGQAVGVMVQARGVLVVDYAPVPLDGGGTAEPARQAGLKPGDLITRINGEPVDSDAEAVRLIDRAGRQGEPVEVEVRRGDQVLTRRIEPLYNRDQQRFAIGIWVRDRVAGVGTLTFYHPGTGRYAALGHVVADPETQVPLPVGDGQILPARITAIEPSRRGDPGEKIGVVPPGATALGTIDRNTPVGIAGRLLAEPRPGPVRHPVPVATAGEVHPGPAQILTVLDGEEPRAFQVEIQRVTGAGDGRDLVIRVTDPELLARTGGIVQGMSGSPILQDGRLVGAVTHVFVNDATRGYGVLAERMLEPAGLAGPAAAPTAQGGLPAPDGAQAVSAGARWGPAAGEVPAAMAVEEPARNGLVITPGPGSLRGPGFPAFHPTRRPGRGRRLGGKQALAPQTPGTRRRLSVTHALSRTGAASCRISSTSFVVIPAGVARAADKHDEGPRGS